MSGSPSIPQLHTSATPKLERSTTPFFVTCCIFLLCMEFLGTVAMRNLEIGPDFRQFYSAGVLVRTDPASLYNLARQRQVQNALVSQQNFVLPVVHPAYEALLFAPFSLLKYKTAYFSFIAFNVALLIAAFFAARPLFSIFIPWMQPMPGMIFFFFLPIVITIWQGQDSILFLLLCCCTWRQLHRGKDLNAGVILALALFRFQLALPIAILIAVRKGWRFSIGFLASAVAVVLLSVAITGRAGAVTMVHLLSSLTLSGDHSAAAQTTLAIHPTMMPNLRGLLFGLGIDHLSPHLAFAIVAVTSLALFLWCLFSLRHQQHDGIAFAVTILCAVLVSDHLYIHDATLLLLPIVLLAHEAHRALLWIVYLLPAVLFFTRESGYFFLIAIPALALLISSLRNREPALMPVTTPLPITS